MTRLPRIIDHLRRQDDRVGIVGDAALLQLQQVIAQSNRTVDVPSNVSFHLGREFPDLIQLDAVIDATSTRPEVRTVATCDTAGMRASQKFPIWPAGTST